MSRVTIEDGKVTEVTEPRVRFCPLFAKLRGIEELDEGTIRENIEFRIDSFGMCSEDRETEMDDVLSFGISETMSHALRDGRIDAVVLAADGCGTAVVTDPRIVQGLGGRISGIIETEPIPKVVEAVGAENMVDPDTARIDMEAGADLAHSKGYRRFALTTPSVDVARRLRARYGDSVILIGVHTTGMSEDDARDAFDVFDIITACASRYIPPSSGPLWYTASIMASKAAGRCSFLRNKLFLIPSLLSSPLQVKPQMPHISKASLYSVLASV